MKHVATAAALITLAAAYPAAAMPVKANGSFTIVPAIGGGSVTVDTGNITLATASKTEPALVVQASTPNLTLAINPGDAVIQSNATWPVPAGVGAPVLVNFTLTVSGVEFAFDTGTTNDRVGLDPASNIAGSFAEQFSGTLTNGAGVFPSGAPVTLSEACTQAVQGGQAGLISCTNSVITIGSEQVPEPSTLALLGGSLVLLGRFIRPRRARTNG